MKGLRMAKFNLGDISRTSYERCYKYVDMPFSVPRSEHQLAASKFNPLVQT